jgi:hypothetical protein
MENVIMVVPGRDSALSKAVELISLMKARGRIADWKPSDAGSLSVFLKFDTSAQRLKEIASELRVLGCDILGQP